ncbi:phosphoribosylanthranilate isomerase [Rubellimicrobium arenae]|uniref:phosphoribosylanthranilate isomerase n=1 Tax=Rubellimicrobium arenae TaxID=2817372 RepID=UPI001B317030|nr:phosphoribosylanthranilate isomerase [Rubellimicrobium arenae]
MAFRVTGPAQAGLRAAGRASGPVRVKVCGLTTEAQVEAAAEAGAGYVGFVFFPRSPRAVTAAAARPLAWAAPVGVAKVGLFVDASDEELAAVLDVVPLDMVQLHGAESPERVAEVRARWGLPVMKAVGVGGAEDLARARTYEGVADQLLLDAKAPKGAVLPGGNGVAFDWGLLAGQSWGVPWMLAGGLHPGNVAEALRVSGARQVDVSSGVESAPGVKDPGLVRGFLAAVRGTGNGGHPH